MPLVYYQYIDLPFLLPRLALYLPLSLFIIYLLYRIVKDLRTRKDYFDLDTHQSYSTALSLVCILLNNNICSLLILEFMTETLLVITSYAILDSVYHVLVYYKSAHNKLKYK